MQRSITLTLTLAPTLTLILTLTRCSAPIQRLRTAVDSFTREQRSFVIKPARGFRSHGVCVFKRLPAAGGYAYYRIWQVPHLRPYATLHPDLHPDLPCTLTLSSSTHLASPLTWQDTEVFQKAFRAGEDLASWLGLGLVLELTLTLTLTVPYNTRRGPTGQLPRRH